MNYTLSECEKVLLRNGTPSVRLLMFILTFYIKDEGVSFRGTYIQMTTLRGIPITELQVIDGRP